MKNIFAVLSLALAVLSSSSSALTQDRNPDWLAMPDRDAMLRALPYAAIEAGKDGKVKIDCHVTPEGLLDHCVVVSEDPPGLGYGEATLSLAPLFRMKPAMRGGHPIESEVIIPINWNVAELRGVHLTHSDRRAVHVDWERAPTRAEVKAAYPQNLSGAGSAILGCEFRKDGTVGHCRVVDATPANQGFERAALRLTHLFVANTSADSSLEGVKVDIPFYFGPHGDTPPLGPDALSQALSWTATADKATADGLYPAKAKAAGIKVGRASLKCVIGQRGELADCSVVKEDPPGLGFGEAALKIAEHFRINPWSTDGRPMEGTSIILPLRLNEP